MSVINLTLVEDTYAAFDRRDVPAVLAGPATGSCTPGPCATARFDEYVDPGARGLRGLSPGLWRRPAPLGAGRHAPTDGPSSRCR
jgi:hypothetical protein